MTTSTLFHPSKWLAVSAVFLGYLNSVTRAQFLATAEDFDRWNLSTDSVVAYEDPGFWDPLATKDHQRVIGCTERKGNKCGGLCLFYHGGRKTNECRMATSAHELTIVCIASTHPILFCRGDCTDCGAYTNCATRLEDGFCSIPGSFSFVQAEVENDPGLPPTTSGNPSSSRSPTPTPTPTPSPDSQAPPSPTASSSNTPPTSIPAFESTSSQSSKPTTVGSTPEFATQLGGSKSNHASISSAGAPVSSEASELDGQPTSSAMPTGAIIGIVLGALLAGGLVVFLTLWIRKRKRSPTPPMSFDTTSNSVLTAQYHSRSLTNPWSIAPSSTSYGTSASPYGFTSMSEGDGTRPTSPLERPIVERPPAYTKG